MHLPLLYMAAIHGTRAMARVQNPNCNNQSSTTEFSLTAKQLIELRKNISKGRARSEAKDYYHQLIHQWTSPESLTSALDHAGKRKSLLIMVSEIFAVPHKG